MVFVSVTTVFFLFPPQLPVTASNMNYCIVALGIVFIVSLFQWSVDGRRNYTGPQELQWEATVSSDRPKARP